MAKKRILHIITGLNTGGAETMIHKLCKYRSQKVEYKVLSLTSFGPIAKKIEATGVEVQALGLWKSPLSLFKLFRLVPIILSFKPHIIQTWLYHSDLIGGVFGKLLGIPVFWNIRQAKVNASLNKKHTVLAARLCGLLSFIPEKILSCTKVGIPEHEKMGYKKEKFIFVPNGFEIEEFQPCEVKKNIILHVGRYAPLKDHETFIKAANIIHARLPDYEFHMYGDGVVETNDSLKKLKGTDKIKLLGRSENLKEIYPKASLLISTSLSEGFSNTIGEAMLCDIPVLATAAGDSQLIVEDHRLFIEKQKPEQIAAKAMEVLQTPFSKSYFREKISKRFDIKDVVGVYEKLYLSTLN